MVLVLYDYYHNIIVTISLSLKELLYEANMKQLRCANPQKSERTKVWGFSLCVGFQVMLVIYVQAYVDSRCFSRGFFLYCDSGLNQRFSSWEMECFEGDKVNGDETILHYLLYYQE